MAVLGPKQKKKFKQILKTEGRQAAQGYRANIAERKGVPLYGNKPENIKTQSDQYTFPNWETFYKNPSHNLNTAQGAVSTAYDIGKLQTYDQAMANRPTQEGAYGGQLQWTQDPNTGQWIRTEQLGKSYQDMLNLENQYSLGARQLGSQAFQQMQQSFSQPYSYAGISPAMTTENMNAERQRIEKSLYDRQSSLLEPQYQREIQDFEQMARNRGWTPNSEVYQREKNNILNRQDQQRQQWVNQATSQGLQEMQGQYGLSTAERQRQIQEMENLRYNPYNEANMLMNAGSGIRQDNFIDYGGLNIEPIQAGSLGLGYYQANQNPYLQASKLSWEERQNQLDREQQLKIASMAKAGGGGSSLSPQEQMQLAREQMLWEQQHGIRPNLNNQPSSNVWGQIGSAAVSGIAQGLFS